MARLSHPHIVAVHDFGESEGLCWLIMEYVDGVTLHRLQTEIAAAGRLLPLDVVAGVVGGVLEGLHAAHETRDASGAPLRIVHRDVSPQNIMISRCGQVKVIDFGVAKATAPVIESTLGRLVGKVSYMSPEQARGIAVDPRSDVFSVGVVLWETLTGRRLFREAKQSHASILRDVLRKPVSAPSQYRTEISSTLDAVVLRALERNPNDRFSSAREFAQALDAALLLAVGSKISAYVTVFCEAGSATPGLGSGSSPATVPSAEAVTRVATDQEEATSLALTGVSEPLLLATPRKPWHQRFGGYALPLVFLLCSLSAARWAKRSSSSATKRAPEATALASLPRVHASTSARPVAASEAPPPPLHEAAAGLRMPMPQPAAATAAIESPTTVFRTIREQRTRRPRGVRPAPSNEAARSSRQTAGAQRLLPEDDDCSVSTYLGPDGIQHFKERCL